MEDYQLKLEEQNRKIKEEWDDIFERKDEFLPEAPQLRQPVNPEDFENKYLKRIDKFNDEINQKDTKHLYYKYKHQYDMIKELYADGRLPKEAKKLWYLLILGFLAILEVPVNYNSINNFLHKPLISLFGAIALGVFLMFLSHFIGKFLRQLKFIIQTPDAEDNLELPSRNIEIVKFIFALIGFILFFFILYEIRKEYYQSLLGADGDMEVVEVGIITTKVLINMFINLVLFIVGAIVSYIFHDPIPSYQETYHKMKQHLKKIKKSYDSLIKELNRIENRFALKKVKK